MGYLVLVVIVHIFQCNTCQFLTNKGLCFGIGDMVVIVGKGNPLDKEGRVSPCTTKVTKITIKVI